jgi:hypothetical protein
MSFVNAAYVMCCKSSFVQNGIPPPEVSSEEDTRVYFAEFGIVGLQSRAVRDEFLVVEKCCVIIPVFSGVGPD